MAKELVWNERFNIGVEKVDKAHRRLFSIVYKLMVLSEDEKKRKWASAEAIKFFKSYALKHFAEEEEYMRSIHYDGYEMHKRLHDVMRDKTIPALEKDLEENDYSSESIQHFIGISLGWLTGHVLIEDRAITGKVPKRWDSVQPKNVTAAMEKVVSQIILEVFKLQTRTVSLQYAGEDFGKCIYDRISYRSKEGKRLHVFLVMEERLALRTVGQMLDIEFKKVDKMVLDAVRQISQQMMVHMRGYFKMLEQYEFEKDHMLTKEQLEQDFLSEYPRYSLLFDTGIGYFAFCIKMR
ncbi:MAG: hypothetical protein HFG32_01315 [Eubacterium sp.]|jgi:hemerythrin-like metal-binding protein|nr:hypothetical protein [Eubacterium sp.]